MSSFAAPASNPMGESLGADDIELRHPNPGKLDIVASFTNAFELVKAHPAETIAGAMGMFIAVGLVNLVLTIIQGIFVAILSAGVQQTGSEAAGYAVLGVQIVMQIFASIIIVVIQAVLSGGYNILWLRIVRGEEVSFNNVMEVKPFILPLILTTILMQVAIMFGMIFLIVPGILIGLGCGFAPFVVIDKNLSLVDALKASWRITDGYKMDIFLFGILASIVNFIGVIPCGLGLIITIPVSLGAMASIYSQIAAPGRAYAEGEQLLHAFE